MLKYRIRSYFADCIIEIYKENGYWTYQSGYRRAQNFYAMNQQNQQSKQSDDSRKCSCGRTVSGNICPDCGAKKPETKKEGEWTCKCGSKTTGKFCPECGDPFDDKDAR